jgi:nucleoside-diphosphate-sugar epimerase
MNSTADISALCALGWQPTVSVEQGIRRILEIYRIAPDA